jgi:hypothetical protein
MGEYSSKRIEEMNERERDTIVSCMKSVEYIWLFFKDSEGNDIHVQTNIESALGIIYNTNGYKYHVQIKNDAPNNFVNLIII